jgi:hypothetical protein
MISFKTGGDYNNLNGIKEDYAEPNGIIVITKNKKQNKDLFS